MNIINSLKQKIIKILDPIFHFKTQRKMKVKLIKDGSWSLIINLASKVLSMLTGVLLFRLLGASQYGIYSYVLSLVFTLTIPVEFGLPSLIIRETAKGLTKEEHSATKGIWIWALRVSLLISVIVIIGALIVGFFFEDFFKQSDINTLFWGVALLLVWPLVHISSAVLRGLDKVVLGQIPNLVIINGLFVLLLAIFGFLIPVGLNSANAMGFRLISTVFAAVFGVGFLLIKVPDDVKKARPEYHGRSWFSSALPLGLTSGLNTIKNRAGILLLGFFVTSDQIGIYQVAVNTAIIAGIVLQVINTVLAPKFAALYAAGKMKSLQHLVTVSARVAVFFNVAITIVFVLFGRQLLLLLFGQEAVGAYLPLIVMLAGQMVNSLAGSVAFLLNMTGHEKSVMKAIGLSVVINIVSNLIFAPLWGVTGAAFATALSLMFAQVMMWAIVREKININTLAFGRSPLED